MKSIASSADEITEAPRIAKNKPQARPMTHKKPHGIQSAPSEGEYIESILEILDKEMAAAVTTAPIKRYTTKSAIPLTTRIVSLTATK